MVGIISERRPDRKEKFPFPKIALGKSAVTVLLYRLK